MFNLEIRPSYDLIFSNTNEETIFEHYLGLPVKRGIFSNPMREDKHPSASFFRTKKGLYFRDHAQNINYGCLDVVMEIFACSYLEAIDIVCNDFGLASSDIVKNERKIEYTGSTMEESESALIQCSFKPFNKTELDWWLQFGITEKTLKKFNVRSVKYLFINGNLRITNSDEKMLIFGYYFGKIDGIENWKIYMPKGRVRFYCNTTLFQGTRQLRRKSDTLIITSSMKDVMALYEAGYEAIAPQSESVNLTEEIKSKLEKVYKHIYVFYDHDKAGFDKAEKIKKEFGWNYFTTNSSNFKDPADYAREYSIEKLKEYVRDKIKSK